MLVSFNIESANQRFRHAYFHSDAHALALEKLVRLSSETPGSFSYDDGKSKKNVT